MARDPIVEEVRRIRDEIAREHDYDIRAIAVTLRRREIESDRQHVALPPKRVPLPEGEGQAR